MRPLRTNGGFVVLCHLLAAPAHGFSSWARPSTSPGPAASRRALGSRSARAGGAVPAETRSAPRALGTSGEWSAYLDELKGLVYYFNPRTGESKWEAPLEADFSNIQTKIGAAKKLEMRERLKNYLEDRMQTSSATEFLGALPDDLRTTQVERRDAGERPQIETSIPAVAPSAIPAAQQAGGANVLVSQWREWQAFRDEKRGKIYYYNTQTRSSRWARPGGFSDVNASAEEQKQRSAARLSEAADTGTKGEEEGNRTSVEAANSANEAEARTSVPPRQDELGAADGAADDITEQPEINSLPIVQQGAWSAHFDIRTGVVFYFNEATGATSWDPPFPDFPRIVMDNTVPKVLEPGAGNISMERALGYSNVGVDATAEAAAWEEAKRRERARKAKMRAAAAEAQVKEAEAGFAAAEGGGAAPVDVYETAKRAEVDRLEREQRATATEAEKARKEREAAVQLAAREKLEQERIHLAAKEREATAKLAIQEKLEQERLAKAAEKNALLPEQVRAPVLPKQDPTFTADTVEALVAPLQTRSLYDMLQCPPSASRAELKRSYLSLAKLSHPDALLQRGLADTAATAGRFADISRAWKVLGDTQSRRRYDRELLGKGVSSKAGNLFETWVMGAARAMDEALAKAENDLDGGGGRQP